MPGVPFFVDGKISEEDKEYIEFIDKIMLSDDDYIKSIEFVTITKEDVERVRNNNKK